ncbi:MAG: tail protein X [Hyphomicrobium sp.]|uniref:tail protein X n=1 Tax=Hyphomicrobium sp. TaxID=82 RepID=UPI001322D332|nr:MAG: hypothetical protein F9K20_09595 [Hyphomicrobium sp.]MBZ0210173.1 tail protein X [Hyphomicrobium sp.]
MATDLGVTVIAQQGDMVDLMVWRHYGRQDGRRVEQVLDHPNNYDLPIVTRSCRSARGSTCPTSRSRWSRPPSSSGDNRDASIFDHGRRHQHTGPRCFARGR